MTRVSLTPFWRRPNLASEREQRTNTPTLWSEMDRLFDDMTRGYGLPAAASAPHEFNPTVDVIEGKNDYRVEAEIPGMKESDIDVSYTDGVLKIRGEKKNVSETKEENFHRVERSYGNFERWIEFPTEVNPDKISASYKSGVLTISLPKAEPKEEEAKKIQVKGE